MPPRSGYIWLPHVGFVTSSCGGPVRPALPMARFWRNIIVMCVRDPAGVREQTGGHLEPN
jgi:hypothetical protein